MLFPREHGPSDNFVLERLTGDKKAFYFLNNLVFCERRQLQAAKWKVVYHRVFDVDRIILILIETVLCVFMVD